MEKELILKAIEYVNDIPSRVDEFLTKEKFAKEWNKDAQIYSKYYCGCDPINIKPEFKVPGWFLYFGSHLIKVFHADNRSSHCLYEKDDAYDIAFCRSAPPLEIESHLKRICKEKGLMKNGIKLISVMGSPDFVYNELGHTFYDSNGDCLYNNGMALYSNGKFAERIHEKKKLPRTKPEFQAFISAYNTQDKFLRDFLNDYED